MTALDEPGVMDDATYFAHPALSHSDTKLLLRSPAYYRWAKDRGVRHDKPQYDFGHVVHELALGVGAGIDVIDAADWRTKAAKEARDASRAAGRAPLLQHEYDSAKTCADAIREHPLARKLLDHMDHTEVACIWDDDGVQRRAKMDAVTGRFVIDLKTTTEADTESFGRSAGKFGYHTAAAWYLDAARHFLNIDDPKFLFVVVEKEPPHLVNVIELDPYGVELGAKRNRRMIDLYRHCVETDTWPAFGDGINQANLPRWAEIEEETAA